MGKVIFLMVFSLTENNELIKIVIHGRGGQGAVTASQIIVEAAYLSGNFIDVHAYPSFGAERRGAPIQAYAKLSRTEKIWDRAQIETPDIIIMLDETILNLAITSSLEKNGLFLINSDKNPEYFSKKYNLPKENKIIVADISKLALEKELTMEGIPIVNIGILGLLAKAIPDLHLENIKKIIQKRFPVSVRSKNIELIEEAFKLAKII